jgi:hypothetical protein
MVDQEPQATSGTEARAALLKAQEALRQAQERRPVVTNLVRSFSFHLEENHFAERIQTLFGWDDDETSN